MGGESVTTAKLNRKINLLIIGQTPPPYVGQFMSIETVVKANYPDINIHHVRMKYSRTVNEIGRFEIRKLLHLLRIMLESAYTIWRQRIDVIIYPPGAETVPLLRDIATLLWIRSFRRKVILVFHASGLSETVSRWSRPLRWLFGKAFYNCEAGVQKSLLNPPDAAFVKAKSVYSMPNGLVDEFSKLGRPKQTNAVPVILFVGLVRADKGIDTLLEAVVRLKHEGKKFLVRIVGEFASSEYRRLVTRYVEEKGIKDCVEFVGRKVGSPKWEIYRDADIFCFPTYYPAESFGNVVAEAMMFELPVVSTRWRAIPEIVIEGDTGFLVEIKDATGTAERLGALLDYERLRNDMGRRGRERFLANYTIDKYLARTREIVLEVAGLSESKPQSEKLPTLSLLGVNVSRVNYDSAVEAIINAAKRRQSFGVTALAVHGVMEAYRDPAFRKLLNTHDLIAPDGQPVRWALNLLGAKELEDRVYGPTLTLKVCERAATEQLPIFLFGSTQSVLDRLERNLKYKFPGLMIAGVQADRFRDASPEEDKADIERINHSGAAIVFVGRGCPRQETWVAQHRGKINAAMIAVGAAFDIHSGNANQAPKLMQDYGLEWFFRLTREPRRLWRRYLILNPLFLWNFTRQLIGLQPQD